MINLQQVVSESRPMIIEFLSDIGLYHESELQPLTSVLAPFSKWLLEQQIDDKDIAYLTARVASFIGEYIIESNCGARVIKDNRILIHMPLPRGGIREFDPYVTAYGIVTTKASLGDFLRQMCHEH